MIVYRTKEYVGNDGREYFTVTVGNEDLEQEDLNAHGEPITTQEDLGWWIRSLWSDGCFDDYPRSASEIRNALIETGYAETE